MEHTAASSWTYSVEVAVLEIRQIHYSNWTISLCGKPLNVESLLLAGGWRRRTLPGAMKGSQLSWLNCSLHFSPAVSWALKLCVILPLEYTQQHPKFMLNVNKVSTGNKALYWIPGICRNKWRSMDSSDGTRSTALHPNGTQEVISVLANIIWATPFSRLGRVIFFFAISLLLWEILKHKWRS